MATDTVVRARVDERVKEEATVVLKSMGLSMTDAIQMMLIRVAEEGRLPFEPLVPSLETIAAAREAREGKLEIVTLGDLRAAIRADD
ncbi:type II toxin-antitoxin system RelB/DinJ family antitoxin [Azotobacter chroococcum]|jgi:DNA-damage-inducible protein J|uniref:Addiction module antitoxin, RelB/DinJ family n=1 Tax=Azotobacter chroococcum NCIMB 8003 TaxID=1328314 RepID=A0A0C4WUK0_9GAMM|nr:type II toxin-antitoxin system RelB/DinJ family antitoxin [Azotobacter chroococcum]AJE23585.1 Addiction module antitoxin, RelB/DinJ family [Azotobacter chroococcum NCIMB 8003]TKD47215.1 type II toxin-antitoxin system RelB/DinJ family antitoxin [Azotobacter chroococcum]